MDPFDIGFNFISDTLGVPLDKVRYGTLFFLSFPLAFFFRLILNPKYVSTTTRHWFCTLLGILYCWMCFKTQLFYLLGFIGLGYLLLISIPHDVVHIYSLIYAMIAVSVGHIYRMVNSYGVYSLDFSVPLMLIVQRISYVAFAYHDGCVKDSEKLNSDQNRHKITVLPSILEYFSYNFCFLTILAGPTATYKEYDEFIGGINMKKEGITSTAEEPSPLLPVVKKAIAALVFLFFLLTNEDKMANERILSPNLSIPKRFLNVAVYCFLVRCQYYFSHLIVESISNAGGLGFNGYDEDKNAKWDLVQNVDVYKFELGTNIREQTLAWNITTQTWLKRVVYERFKWSPVFFTCLVSAVWHGFYPGYYYSFLLVGLVTVGARKIRILLWHHFQEPQWVKLIYDIASTLLTNIGKDLVVLSFWMLTLENVHALWSNYNYCMFFPVILVTILLPNKRRAKSHQA